MRLHTDTLTASNIYAAASAQGMRGVSVDVVSRGSRIRGHAFDVHLTGTSSRRTNTGHRGAEHYGGDFAATWDEWGMFLGALFVADPFMVAGSGLKSAVYAGAAHFRDMTVGRFIDDDGRGGWSLILTAPHQHDRAGHRWQYVSQSDGRACDCGASRRYVRAALYFDELEAARRAPVPA